MHAFLGLHSVDVAEETSYLLYLLYLLLIVKICAFFKIFIKTNIIMPLNIPCS